MKKMLPFAIVLLLLLGFGLYAGLQGHAAFQGIYDDDTKIAQTDAFSSYTAQRLLPGGSSAERVKISFMGFTGKDTAWQVRTDRELPVHVSGTASVDDGRFKAVAVLPDGTIETLFEGEGDFDRDLVFQAGDNRILLVGDAARGSCDLQLESSSKEEAVDAEVTVLPTHHDDWLRPEGA